MASGDSHSYVRTQSGKTRCLVLANDVGHGGGPAVVCEYGPGFLQAPMGQYGNRFDLARVDTSGNFKWMDGNIGWWRHPAERCRPEL